MGSISSISEEEGSSGGSLLEEGGSSLELDSGGRLELEEGASLELLTGGSLLGGGASLELLTGGAELEETTGVLEEELLELAWLEELSAEELLGALELEAGRWVVTEPGLFPP